MELVLEKPIEELIPLLIKFNNEELIKEIAPKIAVYKNAVYTEDTLPTAKSDRAKLNKLKENFDVERKRIKELYLEPYIKFETQLKEVINLVDDGVQAIDTQVKAFEEKKKESKRQAIQDYWNECIGELHDLLTLDSIFNTRWLNTTYKIDDVKREILNLIQKTQSDLQVIETLKSKHELFLKDYYLRELDLGRTLQMKVNLEEKEKKLAEIQTKPTENAEREEKQDNLSTKVDTEQIQVDFRVIGTREQLSKLKQFLKENNIQYGKVE
jgi:hypothetical protein